MLSSPGRSNRLTLAAASKLHQGKKGVKRALNEDENLEKNATQLSTFFGKTIFQKGGNIKIA